MRLLLPIKGSIQNPTFSPDGRAFLVTRFRGGYSIGASDLYLADLHDRERVTKVTPVEMDGCTNVAAPGFRSTWTPKGWIVFASDHFGPMWPHAIRPNGKSLRVLGADARDPEFIGLPPSSSPDGDEFVFERRRADSQEGPGEIVMLHDCEPVGSAIKVISDPNMDARHPQWSPDGTMIAWQQRPRGNPKGKWHIVTYAIDARDTKAITPDNKNFYQPTWHAASDKMIATGDNAVYEVTTLGRIQVAFPVEHPRTYWIGNASWSPDFNGKKRRMLCEASDRDNPEGGPGTIMEIF